MQEQWPVPTQIAWIDEVLDPLKVHDRSNIITLRNELEDWRKSLKSTLTTNSID